jgi:DNA-binding NtrC family response regulator
VTRERFRKDLYFRINGVTLQIPPLRERKEEVESLARFFLQQACERLGHAVPPFTSEARAQLLEYNWWGNVRELKNAMERASFLCKDGPILLEHLPAIDELDDDPFDAEPTGLFNAVAASDIPTPGNVYGRNSGRFPAEGRTLPGHPQPIPGAERAIESRTPLLDNQTFVAEQQRILDALNACGGNQTRAAQTLGISRRTLINRLDEFQVPRPRKGR